MLVGPSGCGKTTAHADDQPADRAHRRATSCRRTSVTDAEPGELRRGIGYVIQQVGLFPHMTVGDEHRHRAAAARLGRRSAIRARSTSCSSWSASTRDWRPLPGAALRRPAQRVGRRPRARRRPAGDAHGRAVRRDRPDQPRAAAERVPAPAGRAAQDRSSSSPTTSTRRSRSATGSRSCARAGGSRSTTRRRRSSSTRPTTSWRTSWAPTARSSACAAHASATCELRPAADGPRAPGGDDAAGRALRS